MNTQSREFIDSFIVKNRKKEIDFDLTMKLHSYLFRIEIYFLCILPRILSKKLRVPYDSSNNIGEIRGTEVAPVIEKNDDEIGGSLGVFERMTI